MLQLTWIVFLICVYFVLKCFRHLFYDCDISCCEIAKTLPSYVLCYFSVIFEWFFLYILTVLLRDWTNFLKFLCLLSKIFTKKKYKKYGWYVSSICIPTSNNMKPSLYPSASFTMSGIFFSKFWKVSFTKLNWALSWASQSSKVRSKSQTEAQC